MKQLTQGATRYLNTANFLRSVKNFKIDIRAASPWAYICGIHWQVAQATSLENIEFYMLFESDVPGNNQQVSSFSNTGIHSWKKGNL